MFPKNQFYKIIYSTTEMETNTIFVSYYKVILWRFDANEEPLLGILFMWKRNRLILRHLATLKRPVFKEHSKKRSFQINGAPTFEDLKIFINRNK